MLAAVKGYYDGSHIVMEEDVKMSVGQKVVVMILEKKKEIDLNKYMGRGEKMFQIDAQEYIREMRNNDRILRISRQWMLCS